MKSLQGRLHIGLSATVVLLMLLLWWLTSASLNHIAEQMIHSRMEHDGEALLASLQQDDSGQWYLKESQVGHIYQRVFSGHYYVITIEEQRVRSRSLWDYRLQTTQKAHQTGPNEQQLLTWTAQFQIGKQSVQIMVAEDITPLNQSMQRFTQLYALGCLLVLITLLLVQRWVVRRSLSTLGQVASELEALSEGELNSLSGEVPEEIKPLVDEVNRLLQLLSQRLQRSRNAMGNLAHSLKHPLNLLMQLAEKQTLDNHTQQELNHNTQQIYQLIERELKRARLAGAGLPGQHFNADEELPTLIDVLKRVYQAKSLDLNYQIEQTSEYSADRNDMLELLGNLLDNACKWASHTVQCTLQSDNGISIIIEDDGKGCDDDKLASLTDRGTRVDENIAGSGLGLAIVKDIVELYHGTLTFEQSEMGGLKVRVELP
ncbi:ATP-binding protein [Pseudomonadota bacterium]